MSRKENLMKIERLEKNLSEILTKLGKTEEEMLTDAKVEEA